MKIAILTQPLSNNYGGILQALAMQTVLESMGHETIILNREYNFPPLRLCLIRILSVLKCIIRKYVLGNTEIIISNPFLHFYATKKSQIFDNSEIESFIQKNIKRTYLLQSSWMLKFYAHWHHFDCYLVGSDQVWRELYSPCITNFFLDFLPLRNKSKRIAYAASFGVEYEPISQNSLKKCVELAKRFNSISVREQSGVKIMRDTFHLSVYQVLDPTMLLPVDFYRLLIEKNDLKSFGLVSYLLDQDDEKKNIIVSLKEQLQLPYTELLLFPLHTNDEIPRYTSVSTWLSAFANANFVVTDSFHGCVFSIIFRKPFIAIANPERGLDRFYSLLDNLGLRSRLVLSHEEFVHKKDNLLLELDYTKVEQKYKELKKESLEYLVKALNN